MDSHLRDLAYELKKDQILTLEGDENTDLFYVYLGKLLVFIRKGTAITPLALIEKGEYIGELSFFDGLPRSADIMAIEDSTLIRIPAFYLKQQFPKWLTAIAKYMTKRIRILDDVIRDKGIKKKNAVTLKPLSIEDQRHILEQIKQFSQKDTP